MPIKWTPETDQTLLLKILETSNINADPKAIAAVWPENQEAPTPRAISERLVKIRAMAKSSGAAAHFSVSSGRTSKPSTPRKATGGRPTGVRKGASGAKITVRGGNRQRGGKIQKNSKVEADPECPSFKETSPALSISNTVDADADADFEEATQATVNMEMAPEDEDMSATGNVKEEPSDDEEYTEGMFSQEI